MIVSLGSNCSVAYQMEKLKIRKVAYPFDYAHTKINKLIDILQNDFDKFDQLELIRCSDKHPNLINKTDQSLLLKNYYNVRFAHEITDDKLIENFSQRLKIRIERFNNLQNPCFVRIEIENLKEDNFKIKYDKLIRLLELRFATFSLILISKFKYIDNRVKNYTLKEFNSDWKYDSINWKNIFEKIDL